MWLLFCMSASGGQTHEWKKYSWLKDLWMLGLISVQSPLVIQTWQSSVPQEGQINSDEQKIEAEMFLLFPFFHNFIILNFNSNIHYKFFFFHGYYWVREITQPFLWLWSFSVLFPKVPIIIIVLWLKRETDET